MYIYFDRNGTIKEVINDESIRRGSSDYNKIYCYLEGNPDIDDIWYLQKNPDGTLTNQVSFVDNIVTKAIPYDAKRDMKYFQDFKEYQFYVFTLSSSYLLQSGLVVATIRVAENNTLWALGELTFNVQQNVIKDDNDITQSQYDYLLLSYASRTLNEQTGSDLDALIEQKVETNVGEKAEQLEDAFEQFKEETTEDIDNRLNAQDEQIRDLGQLQPSGVDTSTNILAKTSADGIWIGSDTGHWYYWNGTQYVDGGVYQTAVNYDDLEEEINNIKDSGFNSIVSYLDTERGTFNSSDGTPIDNSYRARTINFISTDINTLVYSGQLSDESPLGILLYAWDNSDNYIGFWGGTGWVTSGSQYLGYIDMKMFRTNYPNYKFKAVTATDLTTVKNRIIVVSDFSYVNKIVKSNLSPNYIQNGYLSNINTAISIVSSNTRVYTENNIDNKIVEIIANDGYLFRVMAMNEDGTTSGNFRTTGIFSLNGTSQNLKRFDLSKYNYYGYKLTILKENNSEISVAESYRALVFKTEKDLPVNNDTKISPATVRYLPFLSEYNNNSKNSLCLCALKTPIVNNKIPMHTGFLFHKLPDDDRKLYYGTTLENSKEIGQLDYYPKTCNIAISPSGIVIGAYRGDRANLHIWDGTNNYTLFQNAEIKPMGWLYNSGVDFVVDSNNVEHCIFAEYDGSAIDKGGFYVWRGTYPYTSESDWERVFHMDLSWDTVLPNTIVHFHQVRRDPWTNILYLTSGDKVGQLNWWYSTDYGETWILLINDTDVSYTWEEHILRTINFVFTEDYIYWATDHGTNHCLNRIKRDTTTGIIDLTTREKICDLPYACACNSLCYVDSPNGLFMYERIDIGGEYEEHYNNPVPLLFWSFEKEELFNLGNIKKITDTWGGHRGKCYVNYTSGQQPYPAMGFSDDTRCIFDIVGADGTNIGTIYYEI